MKWYFRMAATFVGMLITAALSLASVNTTSAASSSEIGCPASDEVVPVSVSAPATTITLKCISPNVYTPTIPDNDVSNVFSDQSCTQQTSLSELCPGATGTTGDAGLLTLVFPQLPVNTTTFYLRCAPAVLKVGNGAQKSCTFGVTVDGGPPQGPQVCAVPGTAIRLALQGESGKVTFSCGTAMSLKPTDSSKIYKEDCKNEETLKGMNLTESGSNYVLTATKNPHTKTLCYVCAKSQKSTGAEGECRVMISVSAGTRVAALSPVGLALPCVLMWLYFF